MKKIILLSLLLFCLFLLNTSSKAALYTHPLGPALKCGINKSSYSVGESINVTCVYENCYNPILSMTFYLYGKVDGVVKTTLDGPTVYYSDQYQCFYHSKQTNFNTPSVAGSYNLPISGASTEWINNTLNIPYTVTAPASPPPTCTISADDSSLTVGESTTVRWSATNTTSLTYVCTGPQPGSGSLSFPSSSVHNPSTTGTENCILTATGPGGTSTCGGNLYTVSSAPDTSGYKCNSSTGNCYYVSSGADYSSSSTCSSNCSAPAPTCTASCGSWSTCSASCDGGTQSRTCTRTDCSTYTQSQACNTQPCCTDTCSSLGYSCGTHTICGVATNCGSCYGDRCRNVTYTCSSSNVYQERGDYQKRVCSGASCVYTYQSWLDYICDGVDQPCGTATCKNECTFEYCASLTEVKRKTEGIEETCTSGPTGGCGTKPNDNCNGITDVETCEEGEVCAEIAGTQCNGHSKVDCVPKATTWTEE